MMNYVRHYDINGISTKQIPCVELRGEPNAATEGAVGVLAIDMDSPTHDVYKCVGANNGIYTWELLSGEGVDDNGGLPEITADDDGKVLGVVDGAAEWVDAPEGGGGSADSGLPPVTEADEGKIPRVVDGAWAVVDLPIYLGEYEVVE